ncbi:S-layer homology domain-containing protein [Tepidibacter mesophilus]|uniref:S-layer homology domain-containing protein n=1 Tax=Tepidibacter mesophilus TaxID=655607 RepID=UPI000C083F20|nr:S-layer homology domain-containing protein [Tepidibacter mesophilus]
MNKKINKNIIIFFLIFTVIPVFSFAQSYENFTFKDVQEDYWAKDYIYNLKDKGITNGIGSNEFGIDDTVKRSEFITFLVRIMNWDLVSKNVESSNWYDSYIEAAASHGVIKESDKDSDFTKAITREEMAVMIIRSLGYDALAKDIEGDLKGFKPFDDVNKNSGHILIAKDMDIINGMGNRKFEPQNTATRAQAAAMLTRLEEKVNSKINELHGFYAISSYAQFEKIKDNNDLKNFDSMSFGWSRLEYDSGEKKITLNTTNKNNNSFKLPDDFSNVVNEAKKNNISVQLNVFASNEMKVGNVGLVEYIINSPENKKTVIKEIVSNILLVEKEGEKVSFDGVVIDFENLKNQSSQKPLNEFLSELKNELNKENKKLYVAVHPKANFKGYDYKTIGEIADKVILMAHDYGAKTLTKEEMNRGYTETPPAPIKDIYYALSEITNKDNGVYDLDKIWLQISFDSIQWKTVNNIVINEKAYSPDYNKIADRIKIEKGDGKNIQIQYGNKSKNPYITYYNSGDNTTNKIWYEDERSIGLKMDLARLMGIKGISVWRIGNIPNFGEDEYNLKVWDMIKNNVE